MPIGVKLLKHTKEMNPLQRALFIQRGLNGAWDSLSLTSPDDTDSADLEITLLSTTMDNLFINNRFLQKEFLNLLQPHPLNA